MKMKLHIIQHERGGIPDEPDIFTNRKQADEFFLKHFNAEFKKDYKTVDAAYEYQMSDRHHGEYMLRYWSIPLEIPTPRTSNKALQLHRAASRALLSTYRKGKRNMESVDWEDIDVAHEIAQKADRAERTAKRKAGKK